MTTRQTPDAVREARDILYRHLETASGYLAYDIREIINNNPDVTSHASDGVVQAILNAMDEYAALDSRAGDAGEGMARHLLDALNNSEELMNGDVVLTAEHAKQLNADVDAWEATEPFSPEDAWNELVNVDDRTSPEEYPDMCLITRDELIGFMARATPASHASDGGEV